MAGKGFQAGGGVWFLSSNISGDDPEQKSLRTSGDNYTMIEGGGSLGKAIPLLKLTKISKLTNLEIGGSYQVTNTWTFGKNKVAKENEEAAKNGN